MNEHDNHAASSTIQCSFIDQFTGKFSSLKNAKRKIPWSTTRIDSEARPALPSRGRHLFFRSIPATSVQGTSTTITDAGPPSSNRSFWLFVRPPTHSLYLPGSTSLPSRKSPGCVRLAPFGRLLSLRGIFSLSLSAVRSSFLVDFSSPCFFFLASSFVTSSFFIIIHSVCLFLACVHLVASTPFPCCCSRWFLCQSAFDVSTAVGRLVVGTPKNALKIAKKSNGNLQFRCIFSSPATFATVRSRRIRTQN
jgi:hypothetical protein